MFPNISSNHHTSIRFPSKRNLTRPKRRFCRLRCRQVKPSFDKVGRNYFIPFGINNPNVIYYPDLYTADSHRLVYPDLPLPVPVPLQVHSQLLYPAQPKLPVQPQVLLQVHPQIPSHVEQRLVLPVPTQFTLHGPKIPIYVKLNAPLLVPPRFPLPSPSQSYSFLSPSSNPQNSNIEPQTTTYTNPSTISQDVAESTISLTSNEAPPAKINPTESILVESTIPSSAITTDIKINSGTRPPYSNLSSMSPKNAETAISQSPNEDLPSPSPSVTEFSTNSIQLESTNSKIMAESNSSYTNEELTSPTLKTSTTKQPVVPSTISPDVAEIPNIPCPNDKNETSVPNPEISTTTFATENIPGSSVSSSLNTTESVSPSM
ncbi:hypothetical protein HHI36_015244 [Cryptolaemus montrouzieri]|uniref:Uncharacterized protein n=1 Tax=Cryptolaemus montrouzieri TaxID=559131 RepID=A0ABD2N4Z8_9CUCU